MLHGTAAHVDRRFAIALSMTAVVAAVLAGVLAVWAPYAAGWLLPSLVTGVVPALSALALVAVLRTKGLIGDGRMVVASVISVAALGLNALTYASWLLGFDAADAGVAATGLAALWLPLLTAALVTGATAIALIVESLFRRTSLHAVPRVFLAGLIGVFTAPLVGFSLISPTVSAAFALGVTVIAVLPGRSAAQYATAAEPRAARPSAPVHPAASRETALASRSLARLLASIAAVTGLTGVVYALTGVHWSAGATDGTVAMGQGITILLVSALPLLSALGVLAAIGPRVRRVHIWGPLTLVAIALALVAVAYLYAPFWDGMTPWFQAGSVLLGGAIAWWIVPRLRLPRATAVLTGVSAGALYAAFIGTMFAPMLAFAVPICAIIVALQKTRRAERRPAVTAEAVAAR